jgi:drug/metabolite transporter (DMT)-like permease
LSNFTWCFCNVAAYGLIYSGAAAVSAQKIGILQSIEYVMPLFFGVLFYHVKLSLLNCIGASLIIASTIIINMRSNLKTIKKVVS